MVSCENNSASRVNNYSISSVNIIHNELLSSDIFTVFWKILKKPIVNFTFSINTLIIFHQCIHSSLHRLWQSIFGIPQRRFISIYITFLKNYYWYTECITESWSFWTKSSSLARTWSNKTEIKPPIIRRRASDLDIPLDII